MQQVIRPCSALGSIKLAVALCPDLRHGARVLIAILCSLAAFASNSAHANFNCTSANVNKTLAAGNISVPPNVAVGTTLRTLPADVFQMQCSMTTSAPTSTSGTILVTPMTLGAPLSSGSTDIYQTAIPGLGIRYVINASACSTTNLVLSNGKVSFNCPWTGVVGGSAKSVDISVTTSFVAIGPIQAGVSTISSVPRVAAGYTPSDTPYMDVSQYPVYSGSATGSLMTTTCSVKTTAPEVQLPPLPVSAFSSGVGAVAGQKDFTLSFACVSGAKVAIVITDAVDPSNRLTVLKLATGSTAAGIGVQVLKDQGTPVQFGPDAVGTSVANQWLIGPSPNGTLDLPLSAQYIRTGTVKPGKVRALATFTMSYQ
jgi:type 1 fimbria pilin